MQDQLVSWCRLQGSNLHQPLGIAHRDSDEEGRSHTNGRPIRPGDSDNVIPFQWHCYSLAIAAVIALATPAMARGQQAALMAPVCDPVERPLTTSEKQETQLLMKRLDERELDDRQIESILCRLRALGVDYQ